MVKGHHLELKLHPLLFCNYKEFNFKVSATHHPYIHEVDELLAKDSIETSTGGPGFYSVFLCLSIQVVYVSCLILSN